MGRTREKMNYIIGIDEVGRGPLAGPVTVCAFAILEHDLKLLEPIGAKDSKIVSEQKRDVIAHKLRALAQEGKCVYKISSTSSKVIDKKGLTQAIQLALDTSLKKLNIHPEQAEVYLDGGLKAPQKFLNQHTIIKGDGKITVISCASILAKVYRDALMNRYHKQFPQYGFDRNKGYGTQGHYKAIKKNGMTSIHRRLFLKNTTLVA